MTNYSLNVTPRNIEYFQDMLENKISFSLVRYGDGEFASILGYPGQNCDGVKYTSELQSALLQTLRYPHIYNNYYYGILAIALRKMKSHVEKFSAAQHLDIPWIEATFLVAANRQGKFASFLKVLRSRPIIYVGPEYMRGLQGATKIPVKEFITVPDRTAFESRYSIIDKVMSKRNSSDIIGFSAGPVTKWLIWSLYPELGKSHTLFDFGSIFDGYTGHLSRKYHKRSNWWEILKANLS